MSSDTHVSDNPVTPPTDAGTPDAQENSVPTPETGNGAPPVVATETYVFNAATVVADYRTGLVAKSVARDLIMAAITACDPTSPDYAVTVPGLVKTLADLATAERKTAKTGPTADDFAAAITARASAFIRAAQKLVNGDSMPSDVPDELADQVRSIVRVRWADGEITDDVPESEQKSADASAVRSVVTRNAMADHLAAVVRGDARLASGAVFPIVAGKTYRVSEIANLRTDVYPSGASHGHLSSRFVGAKGIVKDPSDWIVGWEYRKTDKGAHGLAYVGTADQHSDQPTDAPESDTDASE